MPKVLKLGGKMKTIQMGSDELFNVGDRVMINSRGYMLSPTKTINLRSKGTVTKVYPNTVLVDVDQFKNDPRGMSDEFQFKSLTKI